MKTCPRCKEALPLDCFGKNKARADGLQSHCKSCRRSINNEHYKNSENRRKAVRRNAAKFRQRNIQFLNEFKSSGCAKCGESEICTLDFHHLGQDKDFDLSKKKDRFSIERLKKEIEKCIVVCSNCHRKIHAGVIPE